MTKKRENDEASKSWFRSSRLFQQDGSWFFVTREGSTEGPFSDRRQAELRLEDYIKVMQSGWLKPNVNDELTILPKE